MRTWIQRVRNHRHHVLTIKTFCVIGQIREICLMKDTPDRRIIFVSSPFFGKAGLSEINSFLPLAAYSFVDNFFFSLTIPASYIDDSYIETIGI